MITAVKKIYPGENLKVNLRLRQADGKTAFSVSNIQSATFNFMQYGRSVLTLDLSAEEVSVADNVITVELSEGLSRKLNRGLVRLGAVLNILDSTFDSGKKVKIGEFLVCEVVP